MRNQLVKCNYTGKRTNDKTNYNNSLTTLSIKILHRALPILIVDLGQSRIGLVWLVMMCCVNNAKTKQKKNYKYITIKLLILNWYYITALI